MGGVSSRWKTFSLVPGVIFAVVALFHLARIFIEWTIIIGDWSIPMWVSWIALSGGWGLSIQLLLQAGRSLRTIQNPMEDLHRTRT